MKSFNAIHQTYVALDGYLAQEEARHAGAAKDQWARRRIINDQTYFVVLFAQLEDHINKQCDKLISRRRASARWTSRRLWDTADAERMKFKSRLALVTEKGQATYNAICGHYELRCEIAHGNPPAAMPIVIPIIAAQFRAFASQITVRR